LAIAFMSGGVSAASWIYPSGEEVPQNLLRIEVRPPGPLQARPHRLLVGLFDGDGRLLHDRVDVFTSHRADKRNLELVLLRPGRSRLSWGANVPLTLRRSLQTGELVSFVVEHPESGVTLRKYWRVGDSDSTPPAPQRWRLSRPRHGSLERLEVKLDEAISASALVAMAILGPDHIRVLGEVELDEAETLWRLRPTHPWGLGQCELITLPELEDSAGNRPCAHINLLSSLRNLCARSTHTVFEVLP
jgi:hypothetical protein